MVKLQGPLFSTRATGRLANLLEYSQHRRGPRVGRTRNPTQPRTIAQRSNRLIAQFLARQWTEISIADMASWVNAYPTSNLSNYHKYLKGNFARFNTLFGTGPNPNDNETWPSQAYPPTASTPVAIIPSVNLTPLSLSLRVRINVTTANDNWFVAFFRYHASTPNPVARNLATIVHVHDPPYVDVVIPNLPAGLNIFNWLPVSKTGLALHKYNSFVTTILP